MRQRLKLLLSFSIFWIGFQVFIRALFLLYNYDFSAELTIGEIVRVFTNGIRMDLSISGYILMFISLVFTISIAINSPWIPRSINYVNYLMIIVSSIVAIVDLELYRHWGFRLDTSPFVYLIHARSESLGSIQLSVTVKLTLLLVALLLLAIYLYKTYLSRSLTQLHTETEKKSIVVFLVITGLLFIPIRGSFSVAPMNSGFVYFHKTKSYANHAAINVVWNFLYAIQKSGKTKYPEDFFDQKLAGKYFETFYPKSDSTQHIFTQKKPNIVLFILESFTSTVIGPLGGLTNITPNLNRYCSEGILFDNFYASGDRTDKGIVCVLSGYPAQTLTGIVNFPAKAQKLPFLNRYIRDLGYQTSFVYGGDIDFGNFRSYLTNSQFDHLTTIDDFNALEESKWGIHDHIVFEKAFEECDSTTNPFFKVILSLSSHEPFDVPLNPPFISGKDEESLFLNACYYTDKSIGTFVEKAKKSSWWNNTVILFVADHGHRHPGNKPLNAKERFQIPFLMIGGAIKKDSVVHTIGNQTDIANTLLGQLSETHRDFRFSKDLFSPSTKSFAFYFFNNGYGYVSEDKYIVHDNTGRQFVKKDGASNEDLELTKAYQEIMYLDYNSK